MDVTIARSNIRNAATREPPDSNHSHQNEPAREARSSELRDFQGREIDHPLGDPSHEAQVEDLPPPETHDEDQHRAVGELEDELADEEGDDGGVETGGGCESPVRILHTAARAAPRPGAAPRDRLDPRKDPPQGLHERVMRIASGEILERAPPLARVEIAARQLLDLTQGVEEVFVVGMGPGDDGSCARSETG